MRRFDGLYGPMPAHRGLTKSEAAENVGFPELLGRGTRSYSNASEFSDGLDRFRESREGRFHDHNIPDFAKDSDPGF